jgi:hypothetical protein
MRSVGAVYDVSWTVSEGPGSGYQNFCKKLIAWQFQPLRAACSYIFISDANVLICRGQGHRAGRHALGHDVLSCRVAGSGWRLGRVYFLAFLNPNGF